MTRSILLGALAFSAFAPLAFAQTPQSAPDPMTVKKQFESPAKMYRPLVRWWWPGNDVTETELRREVDVLDKAGFGGAEVQAFNIGLPKLPAGEEKRVNEFATPGFFKNVASAVDQAKKDGLFIDYTFGSGWPFGGGYDITPELASVELRQSHKVVHGPARLHTRLDLPGINDGDPQNAGKSTKGLPEGWEQRLQNRVKTVAVVAVRGEDPEYYQNQVRGREQVVTRTAMLEKGTSVDLTSKMQADGTIDWEVPEGTWQIFVFRSVPTVAKLIGGAGEGPQLEMDHWNINAFNAHAKHVGDAAVPYLGQYFGNGLRAIFCDSLEVRSWFFWSDDFLAEFKKRRGYDLVPYLPIVKVQGYGNPFGGFENLPAYDIPGVGEGVRRDYWRTINDLLIERFYDPFNKWAHDHKLLTRTQSQGAPADMLRIYGESDIPETEQLYDTGRYDSLKLASSAAHVYGRPAVGSESFVWRLTPYLNTPERLKRGTDELLSAGINAILYHGFPYILANQPDPGWHPFAGKPNAGSHGSFMNEKDTFWQYLNQLNAYMTRVQYLSQTGRNVAEVGLYRYEWPLNSSDPPPPPAPALNQAIMDAGYNYDHLDLQGLMKSTVRNRKLVTAGGAEYRVLVMPSLHSIDAGLADKVKEFAAAGLPVVWAGEKPMRGDTMLDMPGRAQRVSADVQAMGKMKNVASAMNIAEAVAAIGRTTKPDIRFHSKVLPYFEKQLGGMTVYFLRNATEAPQMLRAEFAGKGNVEIWDAWTGKSMRLSSAKKTADGAEVSVTVGPVGSVLVVFTPTATATEDMLPPMQVAKRVSLDGATWTLKATGVNETAKVVTIEKPVTMLSDWSLDDKLNGFSGNGVYTTMFTAPATSKRVMLDLGEVGSVATVRVNGESAGTVLVMPYTFDVTKLLHAGENKLEVTVTNALYNSMIQRKPRTWGTGQTFTPSGLVPSGLMGPVQLEME